jgi:hypothetical protein
MQKVKYEGNNYLVSDTNAVFLVRLVNGKTRWNRVYDAILALAIRDKLENEYAMHAAWMDEQSSLDAERPGLFH